MLRNVAHYFTRTATVCNAAALVCCINTHIPAPLRIMGGLLGLAAFLSGRSHEDGMCGRCAAGIPLDPAAAVEKHGWQLRASHLSSDPAAAFRRVLVVFGCLVVPAVAVKVAGGEWFNRPAAYAALVAMAAFSLYLDRLKVVHERLEPWCPYCRGWEDGGGEEAPVGPDPVGANITS